MKIPVVKLLQSLSIFHFPKVTHSLEGRNICFLSWEGITGSFPQQFFFSGSYNSTQGGKRFFFSFFAAQFCVSTLRQCAWLSCFISFIYSAKFFVQCRGSSKKGGMDSTLVFNSHSCPQRSFSHLKQYLFIFRKYRVIFK